MYDNTQSKRLLELTGRGLRCRHAVTDTAPASKMCANRYDCSRCEYDQMLEDVEEATLRSSDPTC